MRFAALVSGGFLLALFIACGGGSDEPPPAPTPQPSALEIWQRTLAALDRVESVRATRTGLEHEGTASVVFPRFGEPSVDGYIPWTDRQPLPLFPSHENTLPVSLTNMRLDRQEPLEGTPAWVVSFTGRDPGIDTVDFYEATTWIAQDTFLVQRLEYHITRIEGCCGEDPSPDTVTIEYDDYRSGALSRPTPTATQTPPVLSPPSFRLEPLSGACDAELRLTGEGMQQNDRVLIRVSARHVSELGEVEGTRVPEAFATEAGRVDVHFRPLESWCASPEAAVERRVFVGIFVSLVAAGESYQSSLEYTIAPCRTLPGLESAPDAYCFNTDVATETPTPED